MTKSTIVNRAPVMTAWAMVVAERLGFKREEALSIGTPNDDVIPLRRHWCNEPIFSICVH